MNNTADTRSADLLRSTILTITISFLVLFSKESFGDDCATFACQENARLTNELRKADRVLNNEYKGVVRSLNAEQKSILIQEQRNWIVFRDYECEKYADESCKECDFSNSAQIQKHANDESECLVQLTKARSQELEEIKKMISSGQPPKFSFKKNVPKPN